MTAATPGRRVRGSTTGRPIMALLDLLGRRWVLRILWELRGGSLGFNDLQERCDAMSPSVLNQRLAELRGAGVLAAGEDRRYGLTDEGAALLRAMAPLDVWARRWGTRISRRAAAVEPPARRPRPSSRRSPTAR